MDRVRFGRVLGRGARVAARTVYDAVDAATAPAPESHTRVVAPRRPATIAADPPAAVQRAVRTAGRVQESARVARRGVLEPVKRISRAVSLEITGSFFALFALSFGAAAWRLRGMAQGAGRQRLWVCLALAVLFGYFAVSSFMRARRISRA